jgi:hypothetical protein
MGKSCVTATAAIATSVMTNEVVAGGRDFRSPLCRADLNFVPPPVLFFRWFWRAIWDNIRQKAPAPDCDAHSLGSLKEKLHEPLTHGGRCG